MKHLAFPWLLDFSERIPVIWRTDTEVRNQLYFFFLFTRTDFKTVRRLCDHKSDKSFLYGSKIQLDMILALCVSYYEFRCKVAERS